MSQESAGERRLALGEWYREGSKSLTQLSLKKSLRSLSAPFVLFGSILNSTLGGRRIKEKEERKKKKKRRKKSFLLQIKHCRYYLKITKDSKRSQEMVGVCVGGQRMGGGEAE